MTMSLLNRWFRYTPAKNGIALESVILFVKNVFYFNKGD